MKRFLAAVGVMGLLAIAGAAAAEPAHDTPLVLLKANENSTAFLATDATTRTDPTLEAWMFIAAKAPPPLDGGDTLTGMWVRSVIDCGAGTIRSTGTVMLGASLTVVDRDDTLRVAAQPAPGTSAAIMVDHLCSGAALTGRRFAGTSEAARFAQASP
jgi:hypothetical protein